MDLTTLIEQEYKILHQQDIDEVTLTVKDTAQYRWLEYGGKTVQSLMDKEQPERLITPVFQSLMLFLLFDNKAINVLNLGLGGACFERALATIPNLLLTSVEASQPVIDIAKQYFTVPKKVNIVCKRAEEFILQTKIKYDVVLCDLFIDERSPEFIFTQNFYFQLDAITSNKAIVMINLQVDTNERLLQTLLFIKTYFPYIALIEFDDYKNIVIICSLHEIPAREILHERLASFTHLSFSYLDKFIEKIRYMPHSKC